MSIIISKQGQAAQKLDKSDFEKEDYLQDYIHRNPESIPVYEIEESKKLFVVKREFPTESGPIDALAVDKDGDIYIVETKLYKNPDKRTVVAQALDYGASLWKHFNDFGEFTNILDAECQKNFSQTFKEKMSEFFELQDEQAEFQLDAMKRNLGEGNLKFVILMDSMDDRLKDLIIYVNQNSQFDIYAVQLEYYKFQEYEIMIPKIFGVEVKKNVRGSSGSVRKVWTRELFLQDARNKVKDKETYSLLEDLCKFIETKSDSYEFGKGADTGSITYRFNNNGSDSDSISTFTLWSNGTLSFAFLNIKNRIGEKGLELLYSKIAKVLPVGHWNKMNVLMGIGTGTFLTLREAFPNEEKLQAFKSTILEFVKEVSNK